MVQNSGMELKSNKLERRVLGKRNSTSSECYGRLGTHMDKGKWQWKVGAAHWIVSTYGDVRSTYQLGEVGESAVGGGRNSGIASVSSGTEATAEVVNHQFPKSLLPWFYDFLSSNSKDSKGSKKMGSKSPGPSLEVWQAGMARGLVVRGVTGAGENSYDDTPQGLESLGKEEWSLVGVRLSKRVGVVQAVILNK